MKQTLGTTRYVVQAIAGTFLATLVGCSSGPLAPAAPLPDRLVFASFGTQPVASNEGAEPFTVAYAERRGDAVLTSIGVEGKALTVKGLLGQGRGSQWAGIGFSVGRNAKVEAIDLSSYQRLALRLASPTARTLRVRIASTDEKITQAGCYPVAMVRVGPTPQDVELPLSQFAAEAFCGSNGRNIASTLKAVRTVEVVDTMITNQPTSISLERIEFLR
jgi:hypothetical protein